MSTDKITQAIVVPKVSINEKCFKNYLGPADDFNQYNIVFGLNGHGKSTLAKAIYKSAVESETLSNNIRIYNADFIDELLKLKDQPGKIKPVRANFGKANTGIEAEIEKYSKDINDLKSQLNDSGESKGLISQQSKTLIDIENEIKQIHNTNRGTSSVKLKFSTNSTFDIGIFKLYEADFTAGLKKFDEDTIKRSSGNDDHEAELERVTSLPINEMSNQYLISLDELEKTAEILQKSYGITAPNTEELSWLVKGLQFHKDGDSCKFCLNSVDIDELKIRIEKAQQHSKVADMAYLESVHLLLATYISTGENLTSSSGIYLELFGSPKQYEQLMEELECHLFLLSSLNKLIQKKITDNDFIHEIQWEIPFTSALFIEDSLHLLVELKKSLTDKITTKINQQNELVKAKIGYEIVNNTLILTKIQNYKSKALIIETINKSLKDKSQKITDLKAQKSEIANFSNYVNGVIKNLGFDFKLVTDKQDKSYELMHLNNEPIFLEDISEGERNLLALLYFYFEMLDDDEKSIKQNIELILVDDPIGSLDDGNRFYILETVKSLLENQNAQVFIFTHSWDSFADLCFNKNGNEKTSIYEVLKVDGCSEINKSKAQELPYKKLYSEIYRITESPNAQVSDYEVLHLPNSLRRVVEDYFGFYSGIHLATSKSREELSRGLLGEDYLTLGSNRKRKLDVLLSVINILSHRFPSSPAKGEILEAAKFFMDSMNNNHKHHHDKMKA